MRYKNTPNISGFVDLCSCLSMGMIKEVLLINKRIVANYELNCCIESAYNFIFDDSKSDCERAIEQSLYMFDIVETDRFYYANDNMFSGNNSQRNIKGQILRLKDKYK